MTSTKRSLTALVAVLSIAACGASSPTASPLRVPVTGSPQRGPPDAWVTIVEFADFQCPFCREEERELTALLAAYPADVRLVWKDLPLPNLHPDAQTAAMAAKCAFRQGRFWELHDLLLTTALDSATLLEDARQVSGLDVVAWQACLADQATASSVAADAALAANLGVPGTPTFVINGAPLVGLASQASLTTIVERAKATAIASGIPRASYYAAAVLGENQ